MSPSLKNHLLLWLLTFSLLGSFGPPTHHGLTASPIALRIKSNVYSSALGGWWHGTLQPQRCSAHPPVTKSRSLLPALDSLPYEPQTSPGFPQFLGSESASPHTLPGIIPWLRWVFFSGAPLTTPTLLQPSNLELGGMGVSEGRAEPGAVAGSGGAERGTPVAGTPPVAGATHKCWKML